MGARVHRDPDGLVGLVEPAGRQAVAFGAEHGADGLARKRAMLEDKNADLVVFNDIGRSDIGFDVDDNEVVLVTRAEERTIAKASKRRIAAAILDVVEELLQDVSTPSPG